MPRTTYRHILIYIAVKFKSLTNGNVYIIIYGSVLFKKDGHIKMAEFTYKCPACGAPLKFDPSSGKFVCEFCDSVYEEAQLNDQDDKKYEQLEHTDETEDSYGEQLVYTCPSCGGELITDATTAATTCYYCHNPVVLTGRLVRELKPDGVIPFKYTREEAKSRFMTWIKSKKYVPKDFVSEENIESIQGVYYPYWMADYDTDATFIGHGTRTHTTFTSREEIRSTEHYNVIRRGKVHLRNIERSALKKNDRKLADAIHPYETDGVLDFQPAYLSGFFAEMRDVQSDEIRESVETEVKGYCPGLLTSDAPFDTLEGDTSVTYEANKYKYNLLPAWVLVYRGNDGKMYYYSMNGQTGQTCGVVPVDKTKLFLSSLVTGAIFGIIGALIAFIAMYM